MLYKDFKGDKISALGMGNMRLPAQGEGEDKTIDDDAARAVIDRVYELGINYYDTAYMYHNGESENFLRRALVERYPRESYFLADKLPGMMMLSGEPTAKELFEKQLQKCGVDYFDFYLLHNLNEKDISVYESAEANVLPYLLEQKKAGRIRHLGFSCHAKPETLAGFLDRHDCFEFVQLQLNYLDWEIGQAHELYDIVVAHGLKVWVMEPCRGGRLASLSPEADAILKKAAPERSIASWAFRWVKSLPAVQVVLSGMNTIAMTEDNAAVFSADEPFSADEQKALAEAIKIFCEKNQLPCTRCRYCDGCPQELEIPELIALYNDYLLNGDGKFLAMKVSQLPEDKQPQNCVACGACAEKCPQNIDIPGVMSKLTDIAAAAGGDR